MLMSCVEFAYNENSEPELRNLTGSSYSMHVNHAHNVEMGGHALTSPLFINDVGALHVDTSERIEGKWRYRSVRLFLTEEQLRQLAANALRVADELATAKE